MGQGMGTRVRGREKEMAALPSPSPGLPGLRWAARAGELGDHEHSPGCHSVPCSSRTLVTKMDFFLSISQAGRVRLHKGE